MFSAPPQPFSPHSKLANMWGANFSLLRIVKEYTKAFYQILFLRPALYNYVHVVTDLVLKKGGVKRGKKTFSMLFLTKLQIPCE